MEYSEFAKAARIRKGMRQKYAAVELGVTATHLSLIESGKRQPSAKLLKQMASLYEVPLEIAYFSFITESDIPEEKRKLYKLLKPAIDSLVSHIITDK